MILTFVENSFVNQPLIEGWCGSLDMKLGSEI